MAMSVAITRVTAYQAPSGPAASVACYMDEERKHSLRDCAHLRNKALVWLSMLSLRGTVGTELCLPFTVETIREEFCSVSPGNLLLGITEQATTPLVISYPSPPSSKIMTVVFFMLCSETRGRSLSPESQLSLSRHQVLFKHFIGVDSLQHFSEAGAFISIPFYRRGD